MFVSSFGDLYVNVYKMLNFFYVVYNIRVLFFFNIYKYEIM